MEQVAAGQRDPQNRLDDVADGAVVRQADLLSSVHEVTTTGEAKRRGVNIKLEEKTFWKCCTSLQSLCFLFFLIGVMEISMSAEVRHSPGPRAHLKRQAAADAETRPACGEPEVDGLHLVVAQPLGGLDGPVQARLPHVHVLGMGVAGQELEQGAHVDVVVIVYVAEPPEDQQERSGQTDPERRDRTRKWKWEGQLQFLLLPRLDELVVLDGHLTGQSLAAVGGGAVGVDCVTPCVGKQKHLYFSGRIIGGKFSEGRSRWRSTHRFSSSALRPRRR